MRLSCFLILLVATLAGPGLPPESDLDRFPGEGIEREQLDRWKRHLAWLKLVEEVAPWPAREEIRNWQQQTREIIGLWELLTEARSRREHSYHEDCRQALAALRGRLGALAYALGELPCCPYVAPFKPWSDE